MKHINFAGTAEFSLVSLWRMFRDDWKWWLPGAVVSFVLASVLLSGWPAGLVPNLTYPYCYGQGDCLFFVGEIQRAIEGSIFDNPRSGYPFGSKALDFPGSDAAHIFIVKALGVLGYAGAFNLHLLLSFPTAFVAAYCVSASFGVQRAFAVATAFLYAFLPFHFQRVGHAFLEWYFVAPLFYYIGFRAFFPSGEKSGWAGYAALAAGGMALASFGVYYALFGAIVLGVSVLASLVKHGSLRPAAPALVAIVFLVLGVGANVAPNVLHKLTNGPNIETATREPQESEIFGGKLVQLLLPRQDHRVYQIAQFRKQYDLTHPLTNENGSSSLGVVGALGLLALGAALFLRACGAAADARLSLLAIIVSILFLFGTIGGLGSVFAILVSPMIRSWNRVSVFMAFGALVAFFLTLQAVLQRRLSEAAAKIATRVAAVFFLGLGLLDQTNGPCSGCMEIFQSDHEADRRFVAEIESALPAGAAVYQLPYMPFPEGRRVERLRAYDPFAGFVNSKTLRWSYGGMRGRDGDLFYRALANEPLDRQLEIVRKLGFAGIYIDRRGYADKGQAVIEQLSALLGAPPLVSRGDGKKLFFRLPEPYAPDPSGLGYGEIVQKIGYDKYGLRYHASLAEGIDFRRADAPDFIREFRGLSSAEPGGRLSDAELSRDVRLEFFSNLPKTFTLVLDAEPFGPNANQEMLVQIGPRAYRLNLPPGENSLRLPVDLGEAQANVISFTPPRPISPKEMGLSGDPRKVGLRFVRLRLEQ